MTTQTYTQTYICVPLNSQALRRLASFHIQHILHLLKTRPRSAGQIMLAMEREGLSVDQPEIHRLLHQLLDAGLVERQRGIASDLYYNTYRYSLRREGIEQLITQLQALLPESEASTCQPQ